MRLILEVIEGPFQGKQIEAKVGQTVRIGRTPKADVAMDDSFLSGEHFAIDCDLNGCRIRDLNSRNGTQLNGQMITEASLNDGDQVHAGKTDFKVQIEDNVTTVKVSPADQEAIRRELADLKKSAPSSRKKSQDLPVSLPQPSQRLEGSVDPPTIPDEVASAPSAAKSDERASAGNERKVSTRIEAKAWTPSTPAAENKPSEHQGIPQNALESYAAQTPGGRLIQILSSQPGSLMALVDAVHDRKLLDLIASSNNAFHSLYRSNQNAAIAPYLVAVPPRSDLLKQMVEKGWGRGWGVYLSSSISVLDLREFFRTSLMVTMPDGMELFSRFYDPRFFRAFLETCTTAEAERFFGPITSYFMEDERTEILLQFSRGKNGADKKGHLLSVLP
jgi:pSer/pThr/pTyr-binding forkhead associated (FHA) protein